ncbi:MAG: hypothetical protein AB7F86_03700 [Bdellovibrionales bacterium]
MVRFLLSLLGATLMVVSFQNCSMSSSHQKFNEFSSKACQATVADAYKKTYYEAFKVACGSCHGAGGISGRPLASNNFDEAVNSFQSIGRAKVELNAVNPGHKPPWTGPQNADLIVNSKSIWRDADVVLEECYGEANDIKTIEKKLPANTYTQNPNNNATWPKLDFDLRTEISNEDRLGKIQLNLSVEFRRSRVNNEYVGYDVRNIRGKILSSNSDLKYRVQNIRLVKNKQKLGDFTFFREIDIIVGGAADMLLMNAGWATVFGAVDSTDTFGLRIGSIEEAHIVTFQDLTSNDPVLGVLAANCTTCHNAANKATYGNLDLTNFAEAKAQATSGNLVSRINNAAAPMPPTGLMSADKRSTIEQWVAIGSPQTVADLTSGVGAGTVTGGQTYTVPQTVTYADLMQTTDTTLGVFRRYCVGCHSGANPSGGFNITVQAQAESRAADIVMRMNSSDNNVVMPKSGRLNGLPQAIVQVWADPIIGSQQPAYVIPATVSYNDLMQTTDEILGVFKKNCASCHSGAMPSGNFDITVYAQAQARAANIIARMKSNDSMMVMPKTGKLDQTAQDIVQKWVDGGATQN